MQPKRVVIILSHARSGGTLLTQCFEDVDGGVLVFNEPEIFAHLAQRLDVENQNDFEIALMDVLFCFCRAFWTRSTSPANAASPSTIVIKILPHLLFLVKPLLKIREEMEPFFDMSFVFLYRNPVDCIKSSLR